jgi:hypothetical protein
MTTEMAPETSVPYRHLMRLMAREKFMELGRRESSVLSRQSTADIAPITKADQEESWKRSKMAILTSSHYKYKLVAVEKRAKAKQKRKRSPFPIKTIRGRKRRINQRNLLYHCSILYYNFCCLLISSPCPDRLWGPPNLLSNGHRRLFVPGVKRVGREADHWALHLVPRLRIRWAIPPLPQYVFKPRGN